MDVSLTEFADSVAVHASQTQFLPGGTLSFPSVQSRMVLGCHDGAGEVIINSVMHEVTAGDLLVLPWGHSVTYQADTKSPYFVYGIHIVPWHDSDRAIELDVADRPGHPQHDVAWRSRGDDLIEDVVVSRERERPRLTALIRYGIAVFADPTIAEARLIGRLARHELAQPAVRGQIVIDELPARVRRLAVWVRDHLSDGPITVEQLVNLDGSSPATVARLFADHLHSPPARWISEQRVEYAQRALASTTLSVVQVAQLTGYRDPYYFSRQFKAIAGLSPRAWRDRRTV